MAAGLTIDSLARDAGLPVRTIREYHTLRLLPPPQRSGRIGLYGPRHSQRLELISRLQRRGYSLAGIRDLLDAWEAGGDLSGLLGVGPQPAPPDEVPARLTRAELSARLPSLDPDRACAAGLARSDGDDLLVRSPALLALVADGVAAGADLDEMLGLVRALTTGLGSLAQVLADLLVDRLTSLAADEARPLLQRGRSLLLQGAASILADRLAAALTDRAEAAPGGEVLRAAIDQIRVGAVTDAAGHLLPREAY